MTSLAGWLARTATITGERGVHDQEQWNRDQYGLGLGRDIDFGEGRRSGRSVYVDVDVDVSGLVHSMNTLRYGTNESARQSVRISGPRGSTCVEMKVDLGELVVRERT